MTTMTTTEPTPASWNNTGGMVQIHLVPAGTRVIVNPTPDEARFTDHFQVTTPTCGLGTYHGSWTYRDPYNLTPPYRPCPTCFPDFA